MTKILSECLWRMQYGYGFVLRLMDRYFAGKDERNREDVQRQSTR